jgi:glycosyltransferase involved in cell wall biosynthesis
LDGVRLDVWGDGIDRTRLLTQLRLFGVEDCVSLQGTFAPGDQLDDIASRTTVFLLPSLIEGRPIALMEMAVRGVPTVATETTGAVEILGADYPWLVPVGDTHALASALRDLLVQPDSWCRAVEWVLRASRPFVVTAGRSSPVLECHRHLYGMEVAR